MGGAPNTSASSTTRSGDNQGRYGDMKLDGARFWVAGDLGAEFSDGEMDWAVLTFDPAVTPGAARGDQTILGRVYPVKWKSFTVAPDARWSGRRRRTSPRRSWTAARWARSVLHRNRQGNTDAPIVIQNLKYWGAPRNDGFVLMQNEVEAFRARRQAVRVQGHQRLHDHVRHRREGRDGREVAGATEVG